MGRRKDHERGARPFYPRGNGVERKPRAKVPNWAITEESVMMDDVKKSSMSFYLRQLSGMLGRREKVSSDSELEQKAREFFDYCAQINMFPTLEAFALYIGYDIHMIAEWAAGRKPLRHDLPGETSVSITNRIKCAFAALDGYLAMDGSANTVAYIFRAKNYYDMVNEDRISHSVESAIPAPMSTAEIAALVGVGDNAPAALPPIEDDII